MMRIIRTFEDFRQPDPCINITDCLQCIQSGCYLGDFWGNGVEKCVDFITLTGGWSIYGWFSFIGIGDEGMCSIRHQWVIPPPDSVVTEVAESYVTLLKLIVVFGYVVLALLSYCIGRFVWRELEEIREEKKMLQELGQLLHQNQVQRGIQPEQQMPENNEDNSDEDEEEEEWQDIEGNVWRRVIPIYTQFSRRRG